MSEPNTKSKTMLWGGRFTEGMDSLMEKFNASIGIDKNMWKADIEGSKAYANALNAAGLLKDNEKSMIVSGKVFNSYNYLYFLYLYVSYLNF